MVRVEMVSFEGQVEARVGLRKVEEEVEGEGSIHTMDTTTMEEEEGGGDIIFLPPAEEVEEEDGIEGAGIRSSNVAEADIIVQPPRTIIWNDRQVWAAGAVSEATVTVERVEAVDIITVVLAAVYHPRELPSIPRTPLTRNAVEASDDHRSLPTLVATSASATAPLYLSQLTLLLQHGLPRPVHRNLVP